MTSLTNQPINRSPVSAEYLRNITHIQNITLGTGVAILATLPILLAFFPERLASDAQQNLFSISLLLATLVMVIRPLADLLPNQSWVRSLVVLRKGFGVFSASIIVSFFLSKIMLNGLDPIIRIATTEYWSWNGYAVLAHLGDLSAIPLLITSNRFSRRVMGPWWKRLQKLSYVYFFSGALYELFAIGVVAAGFAAAAVLWITVAAFAKKRGYFGESIQPQLA